MAETERIAEPRRRLARRLLAGILLLLPVQVALTRIFGEPYPAIQMPPFGYTGGPTRFRGAPGRKASLKPEVHFLSADGEERAFGWERLLGGIPSSHHTAISVMLQESLSASDSPEMPALDRAFYAVFPGYRFRSRHPLSDGSLRRWLARRARELAPGMTFVAAEIRWRSPEPNGLRDTVLVLREELGNDAGS